MFTGDPWIGSVENCVAGLLLDRKRTTCDDGLQLYERSKEWFKGGTGWDQGDAACVRRERVDLELRVGLVAPVHPLGGHLPFPQHDEKSLAGLRQFGSSNGKSRLDGLQLKASNQAIWLK